VAWFFFSKRVNISVRPELVEGTNETPDMPVTEKKVHFVPLANRETSFQSPRIMASFFFRLHPLICRSLVKASSRVGKSCEKASSTGSLVKV
jgi:hypothetical protein